MVVFGIEYKQTIHFKKASIKPRELCKFKVSVVVSEKRIVFYRGHWTMDAEVLSSPIFSRPDCNRAFSKPWLELITDTYR